MRRIPGIFVALFTLLPTFAAPRLGTPRDLPVHLRDSGGRPVTMTATEASPRCLASADFDEDGLPDVVAGLAEGGRGSLVLFLADVDAVYPFEPAARARRAEDHLDALTRRYTRHPAFYGYLYPVEQRDRETRVICRIRARRITLDAIHA